MLAPWMISPLPGSHSLGRVLIRQGGWKHSATSRFAIAITLIILEIAVLPGSHRGPRGRAFRPVAVVLGLSTQLRHAWGGPA